MRTRRKKRARRTLQRNQPPIFQHLVLDRSRLCPFARVPLGQLVTEPGEVFIARASIGDDVKRFLGMLGDHGIIDDPTLLVEEHRERRGVGCEGRERRGCEPLQKCSHGRTTETRLAPHAVIQGRIRNTALAYFDCTMCPTSNKPTLVRTCVWLATAVGEGLGGQGHETRGSHDTP